MAGDPEFEPGADEIRLVPVFTTGKLIEFDMAADVLNQADIPFQTQEETGTGLKLAMPVAPGPGPGTFWSILVPDKALADARRVLSDLPFPITTNPGPWDFLPRETSEEARSDARVQRWIIAISFLLLSIAVIAHGCVLLVFGRERDRWDAVNAIAFGGVMAAFIGWLIWYSRRWTGRPPADVGSSHR